MTSYDSIRNDCIDSCEEAGLKLVLHIFNILLKKGKRRILEVFHMGYFESVGMPTCNHAADAADYKIHCASTFFGLRDYGLERSMTKIHSLFKMPLDRIFFRPTLPNLSRELP